MSKQPEWTPFERAVPTRPVFTDEAREEISAAFQLTPEELDEKMKVTDEEIQGRPCFVNSLYLVFVNKMGELTHLSIRRLDREPCHDWRELQRIKNELVGPECEGLELYPAESRLTDTSNQYHLWVINTGEKINVGWHAGRAVTREALAAKIGARQREP